MGKLAKSGGEDFLKKWIAYNKATNQIIGVYYSAQHPSIENQQIDYFEIPDNISFTSNDNPVELKNRINQNLKIREIIWEKID
jgi:hypothetical protein